MGDSLQAWLMAFGLHVFGSGAGPKEKRRHGLQVEESPTNFSWILGLLLQCSTYGLLVAINTLGGLMCTIITPQFNVVTMAMLLISFLPGCVFASPAYGKDVRTDGFLSNTITMFLLGVIVFLPIAASNSVQYVMVGGMMNSSLNQNLRQLMSCCYCCITIWHLHFAAL
jgi:hypothetical protein